MLDMKAWLSISALIHSKGVLSVSGKDFVQASQVHPHQTVIHVFMDLVLCTGVQSCWKRKGKMVKNSYKHSPQPCGQSSQKN